LFGLELIEKNKCKSNENDLNNKNKFNIFWKLTY
jgi:hypothetical protein